MRVSVFTMNNSWIGEWLDLSKQTPTRASTISKCLVTSWILTASILDATARLECSHDALHDNEAACPGATLWLLYGCVGESELLMKP